MSHEQDILILAVLETNKMILHRIEHLERLIMATRADLNSAILAVPAAVVAALPTTTPPDDFTPEINAINAIPAQVAALLTPVTPPTP